MLIHLTFILIAYLSGSVMYSYILPKRLADTDVTKIADGNPGASGAIKGTGIRIGLLCLCLDIGKGWLPLFLAKHFLDRNSLLFSLVMLAPVLGHAMAPFSHFHGGKAIAVSFGVFIGIMPDFIEGFVLAVLYIIFSAMRVSPNERRTVISFGLLSAASVAMVTVGDYPAVHFGAILISAVVIYKNIKGMPKSKDSETLLEETEAKEKYV